MKNKKAIIKQDICRIRKMENKQAYVCNPYKNKNCNKSNCGILGERDISDSVRCFLTLDGNCRLEPYDYDKTEDVGKKAQIAFWLKEYYGKECEANGFKEEVDSVR